MKALFGILLLLAVRQTGWVEIMVRDASNREAVPGVPVTMTLKFPTEPAGPSTTIVTDPRGLATFTALSPGSYIMKIGAEGLGEAEALPTYVLVDSGSQRRLEIPVKQIASVTGRIVDSNESPVSAAVVVLYSTLYRDGRQTLGITARTTLESDGRFRLTQVPSGEFYLRIENPAPMMGNVYYPGVVDISGAKKLAIRGEDLPLGDIKLPSLQRFKVSGSVIRPGVNSGPALRFYIGRDNPTIVDEGLSLWTARSLPLSLNETTFVLEGLDPGSYVLYAVSGESLIDAIAKESVTISDRDVQLTVVMKPMIDMKAKLVMSNSVTVPPGGLRVSLRPREEPPAWMLDRSPELITARSNEFDVRNLMDGGRYGISVAGLPPEAYVSDVRLGSRSTLTEASFIASASGDQLEIHIGMPGGIIKGIVRDAKGEPVAAASVVLVPDFALRKNPLFYRRAATDANAEFSMQGLAPGEYHLFAWPTPPRTGAEQDPAFLGPFESRSTRVRVTPGVMTETVLRLLQ